MDMCGSYDPRPQSAGIGCQIGISLAVLPYKGEKGYTHTLSLSPSLYLGKKYNHFYMLDGHCVRSLSFEVILSLLRGSSYIGQLNCHLYMPTQQKALKTKICD